MPAASHPTSPSMPLSAGLPVKVRCYLDGLNFYFGVANACNFKWIDLEALLLELVRQKEPRAEIEQVIIFTALLPPGKNNQNMPKRNRQVNYLNALKAYSNRTKVVYGEFRKQEKEFEVIEGELKGQTVSGLVNQEKQSDVNLACQMVRDACEEDPKFDIACLVSGDADLSYPLRLKAELGQRAILVIPRTKIDLESDFSRVSRRLVEALINCAPDQNTLDKLIAKASEKLILEVPETLVLKHPLPDRVGSHRPPNAEGWSIQEARQARAAELEAQAQKRG